MSSIDWKMHPHRFSLYCKGGGFETNAHLIGRKIKIIKGCTKAFAKSLGRYNFIKTDLKLKKQIIILILELK